MIEYFKGLTPVEIAKRNQAVAQADHDRRLLCAKILEDWKKGLRGKKKKR
jgi:hypothetical protein